MLSQTIYFFILEGFSNRVALQRYRGARTMYYGLMDQRLSVFDILEMHNIQVTARIFDSCWSEKMCCRFPLTLLELWVCPMIYDKPKSRN